MADQTLEPCTTANVAANLDDILQALSSKISQTQYVLSVRREFIYDDAIRGMKKRAFSPSKTLVVRKFCTAYIAFP